MVFFMETKIDEKRMEKIRRRCGFGNGIDVSTEGSRGGICLAWKEDVQELDYPWLVGRDFNEIMYSFEKSGGQPREEKRIEAFCEVLEEFHLTDVGYMGIWFTWERGNMTETNIKERLDRGVANEKWMKLFPRGNIHHLTSLLSDHCPLLINTTTGNIFMGIPKFKFEAWWTMEESLEQEVMETWESSTSPIVEKLQMLLISLTRWAKSIKKKRDDLKNKLIKGLGNLMEKEADDDILEKAMDTRI
ncbi:hypothetical protein PVK06_039928 [Gossypium arboreum]|uniref:Reverse transcriptase n=1 Tax=Gossypium arboreum TaxID=29729 RepID=A0ABR0N6X0_GOSAR|nr:hypothetical protein PVK06_039928 [Gossypium arboreum]